MGVQKKYLFISIAIHCFAALILFLFEINTGIETKYELLEITYVNPPEKPEEKKPEIKEEILQPSKPVTPKKKRIQLPEIVQEYSYQTMPYLFITPEESLRVWEKDVKRYFQQNDVIPFAGNKYEFLDFDFNELYDQALSADSVKLLEKKLAERFAEIVLSDEEIKNLPIPQDLTQEWLFRDQGGATDVIPIMPLIGLGIKLAQKAIKKIFSQNNPEKANLVLSETEIQILNIIWKHRTITPSALNAELSQTIDMSISSLINILLDLEAKHILIAEKGLYEYVYIPVVSKKDVYIYLFTNLNEIEDAEAKHIPVRKELKDAIVRKIRLLSSDSEIY